MSDLASSNLSSWLLVGVGGAIFFRSVLVTLTEGLHTMPSLQRRRWMEEGNIPNPLLAELLERPYALSLGATFCARVLLVLLLALLWKLEPLMPGGQLALVAAVLVYLWVFDLMLPVLLVVGDPAAWIRRTFPFYAPLHRILSPVLEPLCVRLERRRQAFERERDGEEEVGSEQAVTALLEEGEAEGILEADDRELIRNVVEFGDTVVREVMTARTSIQALSVTASREEVWEAFRKSRHSRLPVYQGTIDEIVGLVLLKDLVQRPTEADLDLRALMKPVLFVPESNDVSDLLRELQRAQAQLAIVVDEYGSVSGLVTMEDLLEEVFGEIREEHETATEEVALPNGHMLLPGAVHVEELETRLGVTWTREGFDTIAGLVLSRLGRMPQVGESVEVEGARLVVTRMEGLRILQVRVEPHQA